MASKKKPAPRKKRSTASPPSRKAHTGRFWRFLRTVCVSAVASFGAATCALHPQWRDYVNIEFVLAQLSLPREEQVASRVLPAGAQVQTHFSRCQQFFPDGRAPVVPTGHALRELCFSSFAILHNGQTKTPVFVAQRLNRQMLARSKLVQRTDRFYAEARLPFSDRAELADYRGSGYSRGHMAPAGDMHSPEAMAQSFSLANMVPQDQRHNAGAWNSIEQATRKYIMRAAGNVYIFTGPVYSGPPETIGDGGVAVPDYLYKVVYDAVSGRVWVHWQANNPNTKAGPPISYDEFVRRTGLRLLATG
ncbi:DNA/RNA non-specific endonuclease [Allopusillimonas ginsengisoli]|uniref:DNA/RNA non-specific endonuclease n=1 Tax=Allopusillimonas ginsengisoli TaxID=453575 RepID=UPI0039C3F6DE